jgi:hypothetical protein
VVTPSTSPDRSARRLTDDLIELAATPDDGSSMSVLLRSITRSAADLLTPVAYASMTVHDNDSYTTVAVSNDLALAVDEAQYADDDGPCLTSLRTAEPTVVPEIDATIRWPGFRTEAFRLGLRASLSIPLFAGRGTAVAALNLYSHHTGPMSPLSATVLAVYEGSGVDTADPIRDGLDAGSLQLVDGLIGAFGVRTRIQQALGMIMSIERTNADLAYAILRSRAAEATMPLTAVADSVLTRAGGGHMPI